MVRGSSYSQTRNVVLQFKCVRCCSDSQNVRSGKYCIFFLKKLNWKERKFLQKFHFLEVGVPNSSPFFQDRKKIHVNANWYFYIWRKHFFLWNLERNFEFSHSQPSEVVSPKNLVFFGFQVQKWYEFSSGWTPS